MKNYIVLDTETAPTADCPHDNNAHANCSNVYDLGYVIQTDREYIARSFVITDTFFNDNMMNSAYYADKLPQYRKGLYKFEGWEPVTMLQAYRQFQEDCKKYDIKEVWAYNANFDKQALNRTMRDCSNGFRNWFFPYNIKIMDIWDYAGDVICNTKKYVKWCDKNGYISPKGNPQTSAEVVYKYLTGKNDFNEKHTALEDAFIEYDILQACQRRKKKKPTTCGQGWRKASKQYKAL